MKQIHYWATRLSAVLGLSALAFGSSLNITEGPWVSNVTHSTALVSWVTNQFSTAVIRWGISPGVHPHVSTGDGKAQIHSWFVSGAPANSKIYYVACSSNGADPEICSPEGSFTTAVRPVENGAADGVAQPIPPAPVDAPVIPSGAVLSVGANCDDPNTGLAAQWKKAAWGDIVEIDPAVTAKCAGIYVFPVKPADRQTPHRYILTRVKNLDANVGERQVTPADKSHLARFINTAPNVSMVGPGDPAKDACFAGTYRWRQSQNKAWAMYRCNNLPPKPITAIPAAGNLDITVPAHGYPTDRIVHISGVTGPGAAAVNGDWYIQVVDPNTLRLRLYIGAGVQKATRAASGGTVQLNQFELVPVTEGTALPSTCQYGDWWHKQAAAGKEDEYHRAWYCNAGHEWLPYRMDPNAGGSSFPVLDLMTNKAHHLMFQGLSFEPLALKADPQLTQYEYTPASQSTGTKFGMAVGQSRYNNHIYWDRILAQCPDPDPNGSMVRCTGFGNLDGAHISLQRSYFSGFQIFHSQSDLDDGSAVVITVTHGPGPHNISNNHIECAGICVYYVDDVAATTKAADLTFKGNYVETPDRYWDKSPSWIGARFPHPLYWSQRHRFEAKRLQRGLLAENIFAGGWVWNNNAAAICLCTRGGAIGAQVSSVSGSTITTYDATLGYDWGVEDLKPGDRVFLQYLNGGTCPANPAKTYTVESVINSYSFTVSPAPGCTAIHGNVVRLASTTANISDINITNNRFRRSPTGIFLLGHDTYAGVTGLPSTTMQRISIVNNLVTNLDGGRVGLGGFSAAPDVAPSGTFVVAINGMEDLTVAHNTVYPRTRGAFINVDSTNGALSSGLVLKANIFESITGSAIVNDGSSFGAAALDRAWVSGDHPDYVAAYNVILRAGGGSGAPWDPTISPYGPYPPLTKWFDTRAHPFPFKNPMAGDYSLSGLYRAADKCYSKPGDCTDDGKDVGVDMTTLAKP